MSRGTNQKFKFIYLMKIMLAKTDDEHALTMPQIMDELEKYEVTAERKSIYADFQDMTDKFGIEICDLDVSQLILFKEQSKPGRVIVAYKDHVSEIVNISEEERNRYFADVTKAANAIHKAFGPKKVNYGAYGDTGCHLHFHLVPKYEDDPFEWGGVFAMNPDRKYLTDAEYDEMIEKIKANL